MNYDRLFEVHDEYIKIDKENLLKLILPKDELPEFDIDRLLNVIDRLVETMQRDETVDYADIEKTRVFWESPEVKTTVRSIFESGTQRDKIIVNATLAYVERQNEKYKTNYIRFFVQNVATAHTSEGSCTVAVSCVKGAREQIVFCLVSAALGQEEQYQELLDVFPKSIPLNLFNHFALMFANEHPEIEEDENMSIENKLEHRIRFIRQQLIKNHHIKSSGATVDGDDPPDFKDYYTRILPNIGGKKKKTKKRKKTRKRCSRR